MERGCSEFYQQVGRLMDYESPVSANREMTWRNHRDD